MIADDLAKLPRSNVIVQLCGDAHLANFGLFASPERHVLFGLNDFDETLPGPFDWDIKRLAASFVIAARERGFMSRQQREAVRILCASWRKQIAHFSGMDTLDVWYHQFTADDMLAMANSAVERKMETGDDQHSHETGPRATWRPKAPNGEWEAAYQGPAATDLSLQGNEAGRR